MIIDNLNNSDQYRKTHAGFAESFDFLKKAVEENLPVGRYEIDSDRVFAFIQEYTSKADSSFEAHKNYIDIQCLVSGSELMEVVDISASEEKTAYNADNDIAFWNDSLKALRAVFETGDFAVFFPHDLHKPGMCVNGVPTANKKIVVKVKV